MPYDAVLLNLYFGFIINFKTCLQYFTLLLIIYFCSFLQGVEKRLQLLVNRADNLALLHKQSAMLQTTFNNRMLSALVSLTIIFSIMRDIQFFFIVNLVELQVNIFVEILALKIASVKG